jgi:hypothetical protein
MVKTLERAPLKVSGFESFRCHFLCWVSPYRAKLWLQLGPSLVDCEIDIPRISRSLDRYRVLKKEELFDSFSISNFLSNDLKLCDLFNGYWLKATSLTLEEAIINLDVLHHYLPNCLWNIINLLLVFEIPFFLSVFFKGSLCLTCQHDT